MSRHCRESGGLRYRDEVYANGLGRVGCKIEGAREDVPTQLSMKYALCSSQSNRISELDMHREVGEREQQAVHSHATHLKWGHERCNGMQAELRVKEILWSR
ncbi:hypothetical protein DFH09DRAFT_1097075 [Mycena vulgaris]|nr:hypothetical protein DFH09DRAFT_1097075 [Mycena vulgaris]